MKEQIKCSKTKDNESSNNKMPSEWIPVLDTAQQTGHYLKMTIHQGPVRTKVNVVPPWTIAPYKSAEKIE